MRRARWTRASDRPRVCLFQLGIVTRRRSSQESRLRSSCPSRLLSSYPSRLLCSYPSRLLSSYPSHLLSSHPSRHDRPPQIADPPAVPRGAAATTPDLVIAAHPDT